MAPLSVKANMASRSMENTQLAYEYTPLLNRSILIDIQRGGAGNMVASPRVGPTARRGSQDIIPEAALVDHKGHENFHIGVRIQNN